MTKYLSGPQLELAFENTGIARLSVHGHLYETTDTHQFTDALNVLVDNGYTLADSSIEEFDDSRIYTMRLRSPGTSHPMSFTLRLPVRGTLVPDVMVWRDYQTRQVSLTEFFSAGDISPQDAKRAVMLADSAGISRHFWVPALDGSRLIKS